MTTSTKFMRRLGRPIWLVATSLFIAIAHADVQVAAPVKGLLAEQQVNVQISKPLPHYRSAGKISAPLQFVNPSRFKGVSGEVLQVELEVRATADISGLNIRVNTDKGLELHGFDDRIQFEAMRTGQTQLLRFDVMALADGLSYVNVICEALTANGPRMTSYSVPLEIGNVKGVQARKAKPALVVDAQGVVLHVMDAREPKVRAK